MVNIERESLEMTDDQPVTGHPTSHRTTHGDLRDMKGVFLERNIRSQNALMSVPEEVLF